VAVSQQTLHNASLRRDDPGPLFNDTKELHSRFVDADIGHKSSLVFPTATLAPSLN